MSWVAWKLPSPALSCRDVALLLVLSNNDGRKATSKARPWNANIHLFGFTLHSLCSSI
jgi:hypothetical protein